MNLAFLSFIKLQHNKLIFFKIKVIYCHAELVSASIWKKRSRRVTFRLNKFGMTFNIKDFSFK